MRSTHTRAIQDLKSKFLAEKNTYQNDSDSKINTMTKLANTVSTDDNSDNIFFEQKGQAPV